MRLNPKPERGFFVTAWDLLFPMVFGTRSPVLPSLTRVAQPPTPSARSLKTFARLTTELM